MKVLHIINSLETGGAEKLLVETLPMFAKHHIQVDLLLLNDSPYPFFSKLASENCCQIFSLGNSSIYHPKHIFGIIPYLKKYDIIHVHLFPAQYYVALAKLISGTKCKLIFTEHNGYNRRLNHFLYSLIDRHLYNLYNKTICITADIREILLKHTNLPKQRFEVIKNGINLNIIRDAAPYARESLQLTSEDKVLIQIAAFREQKDQKTLIKAMTFLPLDFKLILVGDGVLKEQHQMYAADLELDKRVFFLGVRMDVPELMATADLVVLSTKYEGLSLSSIEGMASGKPFIASNAPGLSDIVQGAGILFPLGDAHQLAAEILQLANDKKHYVKVVQQCISRVKEFSIENMVTEHIKLYQALLN